MLTSKRLQFYFRAPEGRTRDSAAINFQCNLECQQCEAFSANGRQCSRQTCKFVPLCWQHALKLLHLKVGASCIERAGEGLFAWDPSRANDAVIFQSGATICEYQGESLSNNEFARRYPRENLTAPYAIPSSPNNIIDSACRRGIASFINHKPRNFNVKFDRGRNSVSIVATKDIENYQELYANYGNDYQIHQPAGVLSGTKGITIKRPTHDRRRC
jgi:hypothetical protein